MEQKNRLRIALAIILLITLAMLTSFGRVLFARDVPRVSLAPPESSASSSKDASNQESALLRVEVTPQTVQEVVRTLDRVNSYYRELTVELFWSGGSSSTQVLVWADQGWSHSQQALPSGAVRHDLEGEGTRYAWYDGDEAYLSAPIPEETPVEADLSQRIPTYETVLALEPEQITAAGYEDRGGIPCVYVEYQGQALMGYRQRYWVSVNTGLLAAAETLSGEDVVYRMSAQPAQTPCPSGTSFALPGGESLHQAP